VTVLLQVSDPHFGTEQPRVVQALLRLARQLAVDVLVMSGDITQRARRSQFARAREFVDALVPHTLVAIPGNHDIPLFNVFARAIAPYRNYARCFGNDLEPVVDLPDALIVAVNTTRPYRHKHGEVSAAQVERVSARLRRAQSGQVRVVVVHQPVLAVRPTDEVNVLRGAERAVFAWSAAGADLIMGGHIHLPYVRSLRTAHPALREDVFAVQAGTAVSHRVRDGVPNSVNVLHCEATGHSRRCVVERWDFKIRAGDFERHERRLMEFSAHAGMSPTTGAKAGP
jgi:3',5'-cyclic AMP phosphodiesterase CpdA